MSQTGICKDVRFKERMTQNTTMKEDKSIKMMVAFLYAMVCLLVLIFLIKLTEALGAGIVMAGVVAFVSFWAIWYRLLGGR